MKGKSDISNGSGEITEDPEFEPHIAWAPQAWPDMLLVATEENSSTVKMIKGNLNGGDR